MSRAFVNDDAPDASQDEAPQLRIPIPPGSRNYVTPEGAAALVDELTRLETVELPHIKAEIDRAGRGGASPVDELSTLRAALARTGRRVEYLSQMAVLAETIQPPESGYRKVSFGATVHVRAQDGSQRSYRIVGVDEADPEVGLIGWSSPIARALMGRKPGDKVTAKLPESQLGLEILDLE
ncbi:MAG: GreA/GreB family elongation factor [Spirochaetota bacterium]